MFATLSRQPRSEPGQATQAVETGFVARFERTWTPDRHVRVMDARLKPCEVRSRANYSTKTATRYTCMEEEEREGAAIAITSRRASS